MVLIPEIGASYMEEPPIWVSGTIAFKDEAVCLAFGAIATEESVLRMKEIRRIKLRVFLTLKGSNEEEESDDDS